jgi:hypothetical protein
MKNNAQNTALSSQTEASSKAPVNASLSAGQ